MKINNYFLSSLLCSVFTICAIPAYSVEPIDVTSSTFHRYDLNEQTGFEIKDIEFFAPTNHIFETSGNILHSDNYSYYNLDNVIVREIYSNKSGNIINSDYNCLITSIKDSNFYNNGIVYNSKEENNVEFHGSIMRGGFTYYDDEGNEIIGTRIAVIDKTKFKNNSVVAQTEGEWAHILTEGGNIYTEAITDIKESIFEQNKVSSKIADVDLQSNTSYASINTSGNVAYVNTINSINDSNFLLNSISSELKTKEDGSSDVAGGVINMYIISEIIKSNFTSNSISQHTESDNVYNGVFGGVIHGRLTYVFDEFGNAYDISAINKINESKFNGNSITTAANGKENAYVTINGGVIWVSNYIGDITKSSFSENKLNISASGNETNVFITGGILSATKFNGITDSTFDSNTINVNTKNNSYINGGLIAAQESFPLLSNSTIKNNTITVKGDNSEIKGGVLYAKGTTPLTITNSKITDNKINLDGKDSKSYGGAIFAEGRQTITIDSSEFTGNTNIVTGENSESYGGAIYSNTESELVIIDTDFKNNSASKGGAIYSNNKTTIKAINKDINFYGNTADEGGDIYITNGNLDIIASENKNITFNGGIKFVNTTDDLYAINTYEKGTVIINSPIEYEGKPGSFVPIQVSDSSTLKVKDDSYISNPNLVIALKQEGTLDLINNKGSQIELHNLGIESDRTKLKLDLNLDGTQSDFINILQTPVGVPPINVTEVNILSDATEKEQKIKITSYDCEINADITAYTNENKYIINQDGAEHDKLHVLRFNDTPIDGFAEAAASNEDSNFVALKDISTNLTSTNNQVNNNLQVNANSYSIDFQGNNNVEVTNNHKLTINNVKEIKNSGTSALTINEDAQVVINSELTDTAISTDVKFKSDSSIMDINLSNKHSAIFTGKVYTETAARTAGRGTLNVSGGDVAFNELENVSLDVSDGKIDFNKKISSSDINAQTTTVNIYDETEQVSLKTSDSTINLKNRMISSSLDMNKSKIYIPNESYLNGSDLTLNNSYIDMKNNSIGTMNLQTLNLSGENNISIDVNLANLTADKINAETVHADTSSKLNVSNFNITQNTIAMGGVVSITDNDEIKKHTSTSVKTIDNGVYSYMVNRTGTGDFSFYATRFDPAVLIGPIAQQAQLTTQLYSYNQAFSNMDTIMLKPYAERMAARYQDKLAINEANATREYLGHYRDYHSTSFSQGPWFRPYGSIENIKFNNGPKVYNYMYGTSIGYDSSLLHFKHGIDSIISGYIAYNGSIQDYETVKINQNGTTAGISTSIYKNNFFAGLTVNGGVSVADAKTNHGNEDFTMVSGGAAIKAGYNFEAEGGMCIFQPSLLASYSLVNTPTYTNSTGLRLDSELLSAVQMEPGIKFIFNFENNLQTYIGASAIFTVTGRSDFSVYDANLPRLSLEPYGYYKLGFQKAWGERSAGFAQTALRSGGRTGAELQLGWRLAI